MKKHIWLILAGLAAIAVVYYIFTHMSQGSNSSNAGNSNAAPTEVFTGGYVPYPKMPTTGSTAGSKGGTFTANGGAGSNAITGNGSIVLNQ